MFQFFAGDLYEVIPRVAYNFLASDVITGKCTAEPTTLKIEKGTHETINVTMDYDCNLYAAGKQVAVFKIQNMSTLLSNFTCCVPYVDFDTGI